MNEDVVGAVPTGDAPATSEWSTSLLHNMVCFILEVWRYIMNCLWGNGQIYSFSVDIFLVLQVPSVTPSNLSSQLWSLLNDGIEVSILTSWLKVSAEWLSMTPTRWKSVLEKKIMFHIDGIMQDRCNSSAMEFPESCAKPLIHIYSWFTAVYPVH